MMIVIIAHHYVVNSGIYRYINFNSPYYIYNNINTYFAYVFGWGGGGGEKCFYVYNRVVSV